MKEFELPSGAKLKIGSTPFAESKALYMAVVRECKSILFDSNTDVAAIVKNVFCAGFSSLEVDACLEKCMQRCLYNGVKIDKSTFEPDSSRQDYTIVCLRVAEENIGPFVRGLYVELNRVLKMIPDAQI